MAWGEIIAIRRVALSRLAICSRVRSSWPAWAPVEPLADRRVKWTETPCGVSSVISGSTVGLPGGTRKPMRARQLGIWGLSRLQFFAERRHAAAKSDPGPGRRSDFGGTQARNGPPR